MKAKSILCLCLCGTLILSGCGMSKTAGGALIGTAGGALLGAAVGYYTGNTAVGTAVGATVGATAGALIGNHMDKAAAAAAAVEGAELEKLTDEDGNTRAVKVTFDSGILFATNKANLSSDAQKNLAQFAEVLKTYNDADVAIYGHTDNTGSLAVNQKLSKNRAEAVSDFLKSQGVAETQIKEVEGFDFQQPVASNDTKEGRAQNRRVEVFVTANEAMIKAAEAGTLK